MPIEEHKVVIEQELMRRVIVQVLRNQDVLMRDMFSLRRTDDYDTNQYYKDLEANQDLLSELED